MWVITTSVCMATRLIPLSRVKPKSKVDSVAEAKKNDPSRAFPILMEAKMYWDNMLNFRLTRERNKRYTYGDQWKDIVVVDGERMTEEEYIRRQGSVPLKNNLIHRLERNVLGTFRSQAKEPTCVARDRSEKRLGEMMSVMLQYNNQLNQMGEMNASFMKEFLISSLVVAREWFGWRNNKLECWTDYVNPNNFFIDANMRDFRGWDVSCLGEIHDVSFESLCGQFADTPQEYERLSRIYATARSKTSIVHYMESFGYPQSMNFDFMWSNDPTRCRVIEVWRKETKNRYRCHDYNSGEVYKIEEADYYDMVVAENADRIRRGAELGMSEEDIPLIKAEWIVDDYWYFYYLTPFGDILKEGETPYEHKSHPYTFKAYPFIDGEIHSFVADVIDQQRYVNRLLTLYDWIMRASAKGVLLFPEECLSDSMNLEDVAEEWSKFNGIIAIKTKAGAQMPQQISSNSTNVGIMDLLNVQLKLFEDISGVNGAMQGKVGFSGMSASLNAQLAQSASTSLLDILETFSQFVTDVAYKKMKNIQQFYDQKRMVAISGKSVEYDPAKIKNVEFDLSVVESTATPVYRQMANDFLIEIWKSGQITLEHLLQHGDFPFADELLQSLQSQQEQIKQGQVPQGIDPNVVNQVQQGANPQAVQMLQRYAQGA